MGKSPGKWIKSVLFGKKSSRSGNAKKKKDSAGNDKVYTTAKGPPALSESSPVISEPVLVSPHCNEINQGLEKSSGGNTSSISPTSQNVENQEISGPATSNDAGKLREEQAATKAQAAFRGFLARRAFRALQGIIRLQALIRGRLVRRQAVVTLHSMLGIIKLQALVRGRKVRASCPGLVVKPKFSQGKVVVLKSAESKKGVLYSNTFVCKLLSSSLVIIPLQIQYDLEEPNSVPSWMERWTFSRFWKSPVQPKKISDPKSQAKRGGFAMETESGRSKRSVRRSSPANVDNGPSIIISENEKHKRNMRKIAASADSVQDQPQSELEKVKRNLRKVSSSYAEISGKLDTETDVQAHIINKLADTPSGGNYEKCIDDTLDKMKEDITLTPEPKIDLEIAAKPVPTEEPVEYPSPADDLPASEPTRSLGIEEVEHVTLANEEKTCDDKHKTSRRRSSFSAKSEHTENGVQNSPNVPSYMQATESAKAKLRSNSPKLVSDSAERNGVRRHSLPSSTNARATSHSPRTQRILQASTKGGIRGDRSLLSSRDANEKPIQVEWRR